MTKIFGTRNDESGPEKCNFKIEGVDFQAVLGFTFLYERL